MPTGYSNITGVNPFKGKKRKPFTKEHCKKMSLAMKGRKAWNNRLSGIIKFSVKTREKMSKAQKGEKHHAWKGDSVGYSALHSWISRSKGKAVKCKICGKEKNVQWANTDHKYNRNLNDWTSLCPKCHYYYDETFLKIIHGYNRKKK